MIFIAAGIIMGVTYKYTSPVRFIAEKKEKEEALKQMAPDATDPILPAGTWSSSHGKPYEYYRATSQGKPVAYISSTAGKGYSSFIAMLVSLDPDLKIRNINILHHGETPGLGDQVEDRTLFLDQFKGQGTFAAYSSENGNQGEHSGHFRCNHLEPRSYQWREGRVQTLVDTYGSGIKSAAQGWHNEQRQLRDHHQKRHLR
jgi:electron transport complex protein RnfG